MYIYIYVHYICILYIYICVLCIYIYIYYYNYIYGVLMVSVAVRTSYRKIWMLAPKSPKMVHLWYLTGRTSTEILGQGLDTDVNIYHIITWVSHHIPFTIGINEGYTHFQTHTSSGVELGIAGVAHWRGCAHRRHVGRQSAWCNRPPGGPGTSIAIIAP